MSWHNSGQREQNEGPGTWVVSAQALLHREQRSSHASCLRVLLFPLPKPSRILVYVKKNKAQVSFYIRRSAGVAKKCNARSLVRAVDGVLQTEYREVVRLAVSLAKVDKPNVFLGLSELKGNTSPWSIHNERYRRIIFPPGGTGADCVEEIS